MKILYIFFFMLILTSLSVVADGADTVGNDLQAYYTFDVDAQDDKNDYDLTVDGATHTGSNCMISDCYEYDGTNDRLFNYSLASFLGGAHSISLWWYVDDWAVNRAAYGHGIVAPATDYSTIQGSATEVQIETNAASSNYMETQQAAGLWNHFIVNIDAQGKIQEVYQNGTDIGSVTTFVNDLSGFDIWVLGSIWYNGAWVSPMKGEIDEVGFWNRTLTAAEVAYLYNDGNAQRPPLAPSGSISFSTVNNNATFLTKTGDSVNWTTNISIDLNNLHTCWFSTNDTGTYTNVSVVDCAGSSYLFNQNITVTAPTDAYVCGIFGANETTGTTSNSTPNCFTVNDGLYHVNITILDRRNNSVLTTFNVSANSSAYTVSGSTTNGFLDLGFNLSSYDVRINSSSLGYTTVPFTVTSQTNLTVNLPNFWYVERPSTGFSTSTVNFKLAVNESDAAQFSDVKLLFDSVNYTTTTTPGSPTFYNYTLLIPGISGLQDTVNFTYVYTRIGSENRIENYSFIISTFELVTCAPGSANTTLNFTIMNENDRGYLLQGSLEAEFSLFEESREQSIELNFELSGSDSYLFCLNPGSTEIHTDAEIWNTVTGGYTHKWFLINETLTNTTLFINASNFNTTTGVSDLKGNVRNESNFQFYPGIIAELQRRYVGEGIWRTVQMDKSADFGLIFFNIIEQNVDYRINFLNPLTRALIKQTPQGKYVCTDGVCEFTFIVNPDGAAAQLPDLGISYSFDVPTNILTVSWNDPTEQIESVRIRVTKENLAGITDICNDQFLTTSGTTTCNTTGYTPPLYLSVSSENSPEIFNLRTTFGQATETIRDYVGGVEMAAFIAALLVILLGTAGAMINQSLGAVFMVVGLTVVMFMGLLTFLSAAIIITLGIVTIMIVQIAKK